MICEQGLGGLKEFDEKNHGSTTTTILMLSDKFPQMEHSLQQ